MLRIRNLLSVFKTRIRRYIRSLIVTRNEECLIAFGKAYIEPQSCLVGYYGADIEGYGNTPSGQSFLPNIKFSYNGFTFGWIENTVLELDRGIAYINHIATRSDLVGLGLGIRLVESIAYYLQKSYNIKEIHFCETSKQRELYHHFFSEKLGAKYVVEDKKEKWIWEIPQDLFIKLDAISQNTQGSRGSKFQFND